MANADAASAVASWFDELKQMAWLDGGFGEFAGFQATSLDTAFALQALNAVGEGKSEVSLGAVSYLLSRQDSNGGWFDGGNAGNVYTTALVVRALMPYKNQYADAAKALNAAGNFLFSRQDDTGLWTSDFESAQALLALAQSVTDTSGIAASVSALTARQQADGSWSGDVYTTALVLQLLAALENPVANPSLSALQGHMIDGGTGNALSGVAVSVQGPAEKQLVSDQDGNFEFSSMPPGQYAIAITLSGYGALYTTTDLVEGKLTDLGTLSLLSLSGNPQSATIRGTITDATTGQAITGVSITSDTQNGLSAANGSYQLNNIAPGAVTVSADVPGYIGASTQAELDAGEVLIFSPRLMPGQGNESDTYLFGTIKDAGTGLPLAGTAIGIDGAPVGATDSSGDYRIEPLAEGVAGVTVSLAGYDTVAATLKLIRNNRYEFSPPLYRNGTTPPDANTASISGAVIDAAANLPLAGVAVKAHHDNIIETLNTDSAGRFSVSGITDAELTLEFTHSGYQSVTLTFPILPLTQVDIGQVRLRSNAVTALLPDLAWPLNRCPGKTWTPIHKA